MFCGDLMPADNSRAPISSRWPSLWRALLLWGSATGIDDELDNTTRVLGRKLVAEAEEIPEGDRSPSD